MDAMLPAAALLSAAIGAAVGVLMYRLGTAIGVAALIAPALVVIVAWRPELGVYGGLLAIPLEAFGVRIGPVDSTLAEIVFLATAGIAFVRMFVVDRAWPTLAPAHLWFAGLIGVALLGYFFASETTGIANSVRNACAFLVLSILVAGLERRSLEHVLWLLVASGGVVGFIAVITTGPQEAEEAGAIVSGRATASFTHPNVLGFFLVLTLGPALALLFDRNWWGRLLVGVALAGMIGGLSLTFSRSAIVGAVAVLLVLTASSRFRRGAVLGLLIAATFAAINFNALTSSREVGLLQQRLSTVSVAGAEQDPRVPIWRETPSIISDRFPLGWGQGNFYVASSAHGLVDPVGRPWDHAHSLLLTVAAETGLIGLAAFVGFLAALAASAWRTLRARGPSRRLALGVVASLLGLFVAGLVEYPPRTQSILAVTLLLVGVLLGFERIQFAPDRTRGSSGAAS
jgi:putative inorganic carbon (hco3(-)) transporter